MTITEIINNLTPSEEYLIQFYEELPERQKQFFNYLVEKRDYSIKKALQIVDSQARKKTISGNKKYDKLVEPRLREICEDVECDSVEELIEVKNCIKRYRSDDFSDYYRALVWFRVTRWHESFKEALDHVYRSDGHGYVELVGVFYNEEEFGKYLVDERDYLYNFTFSDLYEFFIPEKYKDEMYFNLPEHIIEMIDYVKIAEHALYGMHGGAGISYYDICNDPENPDKWAFFYSN